MVLFFSTLELRAVWGGRDVGLLGLTKGFQQKKFFLVCKTVV